MPPLGLYVHIPFCPQHCPYCAFTVVTGYQELYDRYVQSVCREIASWMHLASRGPLQTVYLGGGTPSMLTPTQMQVILETADTTLDIAPDAEITLEANPQTVDAAKFSHFRQAGVNRLSLGVQAFNDHDLRILGRMHSAVEAEQAFCAARQSGFTNVNIDVMFSMPGSTRLRWQDTLRRIKFLSPEHVSTYSLTIEEGTRFAQRHQHGTLHPVSDEDDAWAYCYAMETLNQAGYEQYEVSNFARPGYRSGHNWGYWHGAEYLGVGVSAHSFLDDQRFWNVKKLMQYIDCLESGLLPREDVEHLDGKTARREQVWLRLRTSAGIELTVTELEALHDAVQTRALVEAKFLQLDGHRLTLTQRGFPLADRIGIELTSVFEASP